MANTDGRDLVTFKVREGGTLLGVQMVYPAFSGVQVLKGLNTVFVPEQAMTRDRQAQIMLPSPNA